MKISLLLILLFLTGGHAWADPCLSSKLKQLRREYEPRNGGMIESIPNKSIVEGSVGAGGTQPHYYLNFHHAEFAPYVEYAEKIAKSNDPVWEKIELITEIVSKNMMPKRSYYDTDYTGLIDRYRSNNAFVPISCYLEVGAGVCREYTLVTQHLLEKAGIPNKHVYAKIERRGTGKHKYQVIEDHAFNVVRIDGEDWAVDAYYGGFHGYRFADLTRPEGANTFTARAPTVEVPFSEWRRIIEINQFPTVQVPTGKFKKKDP